MGHPSDSVALDFDLPIPKILSILDYRLPMARGITKAVVILNCYVFSGPNGNPKLFRSWRTTLAIPISEIRELFIPDLDIR